MVQQVKSRNKENKKSGSATDELIQLNECGLMQNSLCESVFCIGNQMISSAIWNKQAQVNFSKTNKIA